MTVEMNRERMREIALLNFEHFLRNGTATVVFHSGEEYLAKSGLVAHYFANLTDCPFSEAYRIVREIFSLDQQGNIVVRHFTPLEQRAQLGELMIRFHARVMLGQLMKNPFALDEILRANIPGLVKMISLRVNISQEEAEAFIMAVFLDTLKFSTAH